MTQTFKSILVRAVVRRALKYQRMGWSEDQIVEVVDLEYTHIDSNAVAPNSAASSNTTEKEQVQ